MGFVSIHTHSVSSSVGLMPTAFSLMRELPTIMPREKQVLDRGAGIERGICGMPGYLLNHSNLLRRLILSSFYG